mmetsp:Transcript_9729/g.36519  ORF Transcript_9729/g.36519 Transcript_9729/m.36519 type:complete len:252 (+) Transcript_9729:2474-3229(+)
MRYADDTLDQQHHHLRDGREELEQCALPPRFRHTTGDLLFDELAHPLGFVEEIQQHERHGHPVADHVMAAEGQQGLHARQPELAHRVIGKLFAALLGPLQPAGNGHLPQWHTGVQGRQVLPRQEVGQLLPIDRRLLGGHFQYVSLRLEVLLLLEDPGSPVLVPQQSRAQSGLLGQHVVGESRRDLLPGHGRAPDAQEEDHGARVLRRLAQHGEAAQRRHSMPQSSRAPLLAHSGTAGNGAGQRGRAATQRH